jgi:hypothetical protein
MARYENKIPVAANQMARYPVTAKDCAEEITYQ